MDWKMTRGQIILSVIVTLGFLILSAVVVWFAYADGDVPQGLEKFWLMVFTAWTVNFTTIINWNFGSSKGSSDKNAILAHQGRGQSGSASVWLIMAALAVFGFLIFGCSYIKDMYQVEKPVCDRVEYEQSALCQIARDQGVEPEHVHYPIVDGTRIYVAVKPEDYSKVKEFVSEIRGYIEANPMLYFADVFAKTQEEAARYRAVAAILSERIEFLNVDRVIDQPSRDLLIMSLNDIEAKVDELMAGFPQLE